MAYTTGETKLTKEVIKFLDDQIKGGPLFSMSIDLAQVVSIIKKESLISMS